MASTSTFDDSEVGILEDNANDPAQEAPPEDDLLAEIGKVELPADFQDMGPMDGEDLTDEAAADAAGELPRDKADGEDGEEPEGDEPDEQEAQPEPKGRAQKRIQQLVDEKRDLQAQTQQALQAQQQQMYAYMEQQRQQHEAQMQQVMGQYQAMIAAQQAKEEDAKLDEVGRFRKGVLQEAKEQVRAELAPEFEQMKNMFAQQQAAQKAEQERALQRQRLDTFTAKASAARERVLLADMDHGLGDDEVSVMDDMLLSYVAATNTPPDVAAARFRGMLDKIYSARLKGGTNKAKKAAPPPATPARQVAKTRAYRPSWEALTTAGYDNYLDWRAEGSPKLDEPG